MSERPTFRALCKRSGGWWAVSVPELRGVHTQARRLDQVEETVRDAISLFLQSEPSSFNVTIYPELPEPLQARLVNLQELRRRAGELQTAASAATAGMAECLLESGLTVRDIGYLFGLSHQRVAQLTHERERSRMTGQV